MPSTIETDVEAAQRSAQAEGGVSRAGLTTLIACGILALYGLVALGEGLLDAATGRLLEAPSAGASAAGADGESIEALCEELRRVNEAHHPDPAQVERLLSRADRIRRQIEGERGRTTPGPLCGVAR